MIQESPSRAWIPITVAIIGGCFAVIAAISSGFAERIAERVMPPLPQEETAASDPVDETPSASTPFEVAPQPTSETRKTTVTSNCDGLDWETCWQIDDNAKTITWIGVQDGISDIGQAGVALQKIKLGYTAIITLDTQMTIEICTGSIDGVNPGGVCPKTLPISSGTHTIISPGNSGGFRVYK